jgi:UDP-N-acetyl-D-mannosaminuronate dehydrogenase
MEIFKENFLQTKKVSIWGIGYLGYTSLLKLQDFGIRACIYDFNEKRLDDLFDDNYPSNEQINSWSKNGRVPSLNLEYLQSCQDISKMFENNIHIISFPNINDVKYQKLAQIFIENKEKLNESLVVFQSASYPKQIENDFCNILKQETVEIDISTVFRSDWTIEDFYYKNNKRMVSGNSKKAYEKTKYFLSFLNIQSVFLKKLEESEVYENSKIALHYTILGFFNQLSLSYPHIDINELSTKLLSEITFSALKLGVSSVDFKSEQSIENLMRSSAGNYLSILNEANKTNIAYLFYYADLLKSKKVSTVTLFGLSSYNSLKDTKMSPSIILAEYLNKNGIHVTICDNSFTNQEIKQILPYCEYMDIKKDKVTSNATIIMNVNNDLRFLNQTLIEKIGLYDANFIIDNTGFLKQFEFSKKTIYHQFGDDNLIKVIA